MNAYRMHLILLSMLKVLHPFQYFIQTEPNDRYKIKMARIFKGCQSFQTVVLISAKAINCEKRIVKHVVNEKGLIKQDWQNIIKELEQWTSKRNEEQLMCSKCRSLIKQQEGFKVYAKEINQCLLNFGKLDVGRMLALNALLNQLFFGIFNKINSDCENARNCKRDFLRVNAKHAVGLIDLVENEYAYFPRRRPGEIKIEAISEPSHRQQGGDLSKLQMEVKSQDLGQNLKRKNLSLSQQEITTQYENLKGIKRSKQN